MHDRKAIFLLAAATLLAAAPAFAQAGGGAGGTTGRFVIGRLQLTPTLILREAGVDSNVFNSTRAEGEKKDNYATFVPQVDASLSLGVMELTGQGGLSLVYFERYKNQRSVNGSANGRAEFPFQRIRPSIAGSWLRVRERPNNEIDARLLRETVNGSVAMSTRLTSRSGLILGGSREETRYERGVLFRDSNVARALDRQTTEGSAAFRLEVTPLTGLLFDVRGSRDQFLLDPLKQTDNLRASLALDFAADAVIKGRASGGYHKMVARRQGSVPFAGWTSSVELSYAFLGRTRFDVRFTRDAAYSVIEGESYYVTTAGGFEVLHNLIGPLDLSVRGSRDRMDYQFSPGGAAGHVELVSVAGGGASVRVSTKVRFSVNYELSLRESTLGPATEYERRRVYSTATYGF
jgi:hypothetical protein